MNPELDIEQVKESMKRAGDRWQIGTLQVAIYVAAGGGLVGNMFAHNPKHACKDTRTGRGPYREKSTQKMRQTLVALAEVKGLDPTCLPPMPEFHDCGVF